MEKLKMCAPCLFGLESILARELRFIDAENISVTDGKVFFEGDYDILAAANINLRTAERVQLVLNQFNAETFEELFQGVFSINWADFVGKKDMFPVKGYSINSTLSSEPACQSIIKKAIVKKLSQTYNLDWFEESGTLYQINFSIQKNNVIIMLDTSGVGLHKRGYRKISNEAPIKETLAAGIVNLSRINANSIVYDPFCGSGTLLIEAALYALRIAPGINRKFVSETWGFLPSQIWSQERSRAISKVNKNANFRAFGFDNDPEAIEIAKNNAKKAGISSRINFEVQDISKFKMETESGIVICNPPYGERMLEIKQAQEIYKTMGNVFERNDRKSYYIISSDEDFEYVFGAKAIKRRKLYNGMLKCQLYMYYNKI